MPFLSGQDVTVCILMEKGCRPPAGLEEHPHLSFIFTRRQLNEVLAAVAV